MAKQLLGIRDHPKATADRKVGHLSHHCGVHLAGEIAVKGFSGEVVGIGDAASCPIDGRTTATRRNHQRPTEGVAQRLGEDLKGRHHIQSAAAAAGKFSSAKVF